MSDEESNDPGVSGLNRNQEPCRPCGGSVAEGARRGGRARGRKTGRTDSRRGRSGRRQEVSDLQTFDRKSAEGREGRLTHTSTTINGYGRYGARYQRPKW